MLCKITRLMSVIFNSIVSFRSILLYCDKLYILTIEGTLGTPRTQQALLRQMSLCQTNYSEYEQAIDIDEILSDIAETIPHSDRDTQGNNITNYF